MAVGPDTDTLRAFYAIGAMVLIVTGAIVGYFLLEPAINPDGKDWRKIHNNGLIFNITMEDEDCFWTRECGEDCPNEWVAQKTGCCVGCKDPQSCSLKVGLQWHNVPKRKKPQRIYLLTSADCDDWWQTGWAPYIINWKPKPKKPKNETETDEGPEEEIEEPAAEISERFTFTYNYEEAMASNQDPMTEDEIDALWSKRAIAEELYTFVNNDTIPGTSSGYTMVTDGCFGDPYRQLALVACLSTEPEEKFYGRHFSGIPWDRCISTFGICHPVNNVWVKDLPCCADGKWLPRKRTIPKDEDEDD